MANIYVDLESTGTGHSGSQIDPYSYEDWNANVSAGNTYYLKGQIDPPSDFLHNGVDFNIWPWDVVQYGPWRIGNATKSKSFQASYANASDGMLFVDNFKLKGLNHIYIDFTGTSDADIYGNVYESTIVMGSNIDTNDTLSIDKTVIKSNGNVFFGAVGTLSVSNISTESSGGLFTGSVSIGPNIYYDQVLTPEPSDITSEKIDYNLKTFFGVGSINGWAYLSPGVYVQRYDPANMGQISDDITGVDFGGIIQGSHCSKPYTIKPEARQGINLTSLALFLEDNGDLDNSSFGKFKSDTAIKRIGAGSPYLSDEFTEVTGVSDFSAITGISDYGLILNPSSPEYIWMDATIGASETLGTASLNYRFIFEYN